METSIKDSFDWVKKKDLEFYIILTNLFIKENGLMIMLMVMANYPIRMETNMLVILFKVSNKAQENILFRMVVFMMESGSWIVGQVMEFCSTLMEINM